MKSLAVVSVVLVCAIGCGLMTASAAPSSSDVGVFVRPTRRARRPTSRSLGRASPFCQRIPSFAAIL